MKKGEKSDNNKKRKTSNSDNDSDDDYVLENDDDVESNSSGGFIDHNNLSEEEEEEEGFDDFEEKEKGDGISSDTDDNELISSRKRKRKQKVIVRSKDSKSGGKITRVKPQRRKKTYDDYSDGDDDDDDEEYSVFDDEFAIEKVATRSKSSGKKTRGRTRQSCNRDTDEDEEYCGFEDELGGKKTTKGRRKSNSKKSKASESEEYCEFGGTRNRGRRQSSKTYIRVSDEDEEYCEFEDENITKGRRQPTGKRSKESDEYCESEDELGGNKNKGRRQSSNRGTRVSDEDEEYCESEDELAEKKTKGRHQSTSKRSKASASDKEYCEFEDELGAKKTKGRCQSTSGRSKVSASDEEDCELEDSLGGKRTKRRRQSTSKISEALDDVEENCEFENELGGNETEGRRQSTSKRSKASDEDEEYELEDENDEDEEFEPDGIDFFDEEEEDLEEMEGKKVVKRRKISVDRRNRKRKTKVANKRKRERGLLGVRKPAESSDEDFMDTVSVVREKCKKTARSRSKRVVTDWDSDSACSKSSDLEYTISEEEKESLKEAKKFCAELKTCTRSSVPMRKSQVDEEAPNLLEENPLRRLRKGKATVNDLSNDSGKQVCGICLSEEGNAIVKGTLDCCSHYFCFGCIMEWSKVESRCPLCKQRFSSITRAPRSSIGIDLRTTVVQVPVRDQVYRPSEEEVRGYFDPYENVICMECHQGGDDNLMLLCDICDSPAHTYCVGLQREVPEGNWYCEGCRISEVSSSNIQLQIPIVNRGVSGNGSMSTSLPTYRTNIEDLFLPPQHLPIPQPSYSQGFWNLQSPRYPAHAPSPSGAGASTLSGRRRVHRQVHDRFTINRENQMTNYLGRTSMIPEIDLNREVDEAELFEDRIDQCSRDVLIGDSISTEFDHWVQEGRSHSARLSPLRQVAGLGTSTSITSGPEFASLGSEHDMTNLLLGSEQFHHCNSVRSEDSISPHTKSYIHKGSAS